MPLTEEVSSDPLRFVKTGHAPLSQKAQEQLRLVSQQAGSRALQLLKAQEEDEAVDWQSKLASWKNRRRKQMPQRSLEEDDDSLWQRPDPRRREEPSDDRVTALRTCTVRTGPASDGRRSGDDRNRDVAEIARQKTSDGDDAGRRDNIWGNPRCYAEDYDRDVGNDYERDNGVDNISRRNQERDVGNHNGREDGTDNSTGGRYTRDRYVGHDYDNGVAGRHEPLLAATPEIVQQTSRRDFRQHAKRHAWHGSGVDNFLEDEDPCGDVVTTGTNLLSEFSCGGAFRDSDRGSKWRTEPYGEIHREGRRKEEETPRAPPELPSDPPLSVSGRQRCSHCRNALGHGAAMVIESLGLLYHLDCFRCCVCRTPLGNGRRGTDVRVRNTKLHCCNCYSNDEVGLQLSRV